MWGGVAESLSTADPPLCGAVPSKEESVLSILLRSGASQTPSALGMTTCRDEKTRTRGNNEKEEPKPISWREPPEEERTGDDGVL